MLSLAGALLGTGVWFGGEDLLRGDPWYHAALTEEAALSCGWSADAASDLAWSARRIDDYLYNPLWWLRTGRSGRRAARAARTLLAALHFDDLGTTDHVHRTWQRCAGGTVAALLHAWSRSDVAGARLAVALSLHALQDFYSHSSWVDDPVRRTTPWSEAPPGLRLAPALTTGAYEHAPRPGTHPHGRLALGPPRGPEDLPLRPRRFGGLPVPAGLLSARPAGMALDSRWQALAAGRVRHVPGTDGTELFDAAVALARRDSVSWLRRVEQVLVSVGAADFACALRTARLPRSTRRAGFEDPQGQAYAYAAVGAHPPQEPAGSWSLRAEVVAAGRPTRVVHLGPSPSCPRSVDLGWPLGKGAAVSGFAFTRADRVDVAWLDGEVVPGSDGGATTVPLRPVRSLSVLVAW